MPYPKRRKRSWFPIRRKAAPYGVEIAVCIMIMASLAAPSLSRSQESGSRDIKYVRGRVSGINYVGSRITVKWLSAIDNPTKSDMIFFVPKNVHIYSDKDRIFDKNREVGLVGLVIGNHVIIEYHSGKSSRDPLEAINIKVLDQDRPISP